MKRLVWLALAFSVTTASPAFAGGYFSGEKGAHATGRAGAFTAKADDIMAVAYNPAGLSELDGWLLQVGNRFSYNAYEFTRKPTLDWGNLENGVPPYVTFSPVENQTPWQLLDPLLGAAFSPGTRELKDFTFALAVYAPPGVAKQRFPVNGGQRLMMVDREAIMLNYNAAAAWQYRKTFGVGLTFQVIAVPTLRYSMIFDGNPQAANVEPVAGEFDMRATIEGEDLFTPNAIFGAWYRPLKFLELGFSAQVIPTSIQAESKLSVNPVSIQDEVTLSRDGRPANDVSLELPLPLTARFGVRYVGLEGDSERFDIELDFGYEAWSRVESFTVDSRNLIATIRSQDVPVGVIEVEKQWRDTMNVALGGDYAVAPGLVTLRAGAFYETAVATPAYSNVDFVSGEQLGAAAGGSLFFDRFEIALAYGLRFQPTVDVNERDARVYQVVPASPCGPPYDDPAQCDPVYLGRPGAPANAGTYRAHSHAASVDVLYRF